MATDRPSAGAHVIVQLVPVLDERTCQQLRALLADDVATRDTLRPAIYSLAGIATLIDTLGCVPTIDEYEDARTGHPHGPTTAASDAATEARLSAVNAAVKVTSDPPSWGLPARTQPQRTFSRADRVRAIGRAKRGDRRLARGTRICALAMHRSGHLPPNGNELLPDPAKPVDGPQTTAQRAWTRSSWRVASPNQL